MPSNGEVELTWGDGQHKFNVAKIKSALELEEKCDAGVATIFQRMRDSSWHINDIRETLRIGLIGGGSTPDVALRLINRYCDDRPWAESLQPAMVVLMAAMLGVPGDEVGKKQVTERTKADGQPLDQMDDSSVPSSTVSGPQSDSLQGKPMT
jgi:Phage tail tube protein, GTA-gp10